MAKLNELDAIALLERLFSSPRSRDVVLDIGDDTALVRVGGRLLAWTVDGCVEGVHFERRLLSLADVGYRSLQAAVSDLAAMGATPIGALSALTLPKATTRRDLAALGKGQAEAARELGCPVIGGNVSRGAELSVTTSVLGHAPRALRRDAARAGDELWLVGRVGLAALGLALLQQKKTFTAAEGACVRAWRRPRALVREGRGLVGRARACIDVSDGLAGDSAHIAGESRVRVVLEAEALRQSLDGALLSVCIRLGRDPIEAALFGGEDYALLATGPAARRPRFARRIGRVERGRDVWLERAEGERSRLRRGGYDHLAATCS